MNKVIIAGNLARDPQLTSTQDGTSVARLAVASNQVWFDKDNQKKKK